LILLQHVKRLASHQLLLAALKPAAFPRASSGACRKTILVVNEETQVCSGPQRCRGKWHWGFRKDWRLPVRALFSSCTPNRQAHAHASLQRGGSKHTTPLVRLRPRGQVLLAWRVSRKQRKQLYAPRHRAVGVASRAQRHRAPAERF
jgi:hypothetical protein